MATPINAFSTLAHIRWLRIVCPSATRCTPKQTESGQESFGQSVHKASPNTPNPAVDESDDTLYSVINGIDGDPMDYPAWPKLVYRNQVTVIGQEACEPPVFLL